MSDEPGSSAYIRSARDDDDQYPLEEASRQDETLSPAQLAEQRKRNRALFNRKRVEFLDDLIRSLDILVYAELSTIYYLDCFSLRFLLRAVIQFMFLTPKPAAFPRPPKPEPYIGAIVGANLLCLLLHIISKAPAAGEATRFYLHGGLALDFIGQKGPTSKLLLLLLDLFVTALQLTHLSAHIARLRLRDEDTSSRVLSSFITSQDLDSEERGVRRSAELQEREVQGSIELQSLNNAGRATNTSSEEDDERERRHAALESTAPRSDAFIFDAFWNGQIVLADLNPLRTAQEEIIHYQKVPRETRRSGLNAQLSARMSELRYITGRR